MSAELYYLVQPLMTVHSFPHSSIVILAIRCVVVSGGEFKVWRPPGVQALVPPGSHVALTSDFPKTYSCCENLSPLFFLHITVAKLFQLSTRAGGAN